jgi:hypothetical protein
MKHIINRLVDKLNRSIKCVLGESDGSNMLLNIMITMLVMISAFAIMAFSVMTVLMIDFHKNTPAVNIEQHNYKTVDRTVMRERT